jgi:hypothetical protein
MTTKRSIFYFSLLSVHLVFDTGCSKTTVKTLQYIIKYAVLNNKSFKKIRFCMSPEDRSCKHSMCVSVFKNYPSATRRHGNFAGVHTLLRILLSSNSAVLINIITGVLPHITLKRHYLTCFIKKRTVFLLQGFRNARFI